MIWNLYLKFVGWLYRQPDRVTAPAWRCALIRSSFMLKNRWPRLSKLAWRAARFGAFKSTSVALMAYTTSIAMHMLVWGAGSNEGTDA